MVLLFYMHSQFGNRLISKVLEHLESCTKSVLFPENHPSNADINDGEGRGHKFWHSLTREGWGLIQVLTFADSGRGGNKKWPEICWCHTHMIHHPESYESGGIVGAFSQLLLFWDLSTLPPTFETSKFSEIEILPHILLKKAKCVCVRVCVCQKRNCSTE